jgi:acetylornithine deacetylase
VSVQAQNPSGTSADDLKRTVASLNREMLEFLRQSIRLPSLSGREGEFTRFVERWARDHGFETDLWETDERLLSAFPESLARHLPLAGRPTLVIRWRGRDAGPGLLLNAHADVVPAVAEVPLPPADSREGKVFGRGACDDKGPLVGALWAMLALRRTHPHGLAADVLLELVPGEEDSVGLGTLTGIVRGYRGRPAATNPATRHAQGEQDCRRQRHQRLCD